MKSLLKKNLFSIILIFITLLSCILCIYMVLNHKNISNSSGFHHEINAFFTGSLNQKQQNGGLTNSNQHWNPKNLNQNNNFNNSPGNQNAGFQGIMHGGTMDFSSNIDGSYSNYLTAYFIFFIILSITAYYYLIHKKFHLNNQKLLIPALLLVGLFLRIMFGVLTQGYSGDISLFKNWAENAANNLSTFYSNSRSADYPPFYIFILAIIGKIGSITAVSGYYTLLLKLPSILTDIASGYLIYRLAKKYISYEISILLSAFYILNPATFINSTFWGQVDSFFTFIITLAIYLLSEKKISLSSIFFTAAALMKPQGIIFLPVLFFELVRGRNLKSIIKAIISIIVTAFIIILPFSLKQGCLWIIKLYSSTISEYPYASVNAYNFFNLIGANYKNDSSILFIFSYHTWGLIFIIFTTLFSWFTYIKGNNKTFAFAAALIQISGVFTFSVGMHERYLFPATALSIFAYIYLKDKRLLYIALGFSITIFSNTHAILYNISISDISLFTSLLNIVLFGYLVKIMYDIAIKKKTYNLL